MVLSSLATDLSANSARVSACGGHRCIKNTDLNEIMCLALRGHYLLQFVCEDFELLLVSVLLLWVLLNKWRTEKESGIKYQDLSVTNLERKRAGPHATTTCSDWQRAKKPAPTFSACASSDFRLFVTVFNSSSSSAHLLGFEEIRREGKEGTTHSTRRNRTSLEKKIPEV